MAELFEIDAATGSVLLVYDRLVCRDEDGVLLRRFTTDETASLINKAHQLVLDDDTYRKEEFEGVVLELRGSRPDYERMLHLETGNGDNRRTLMLTEGELLLLVDRLRTNTGKTPAIEF